MTFRSFRARRTKQGTSAPVTWSDETAGWSPDAWAQDPDRTTRREAYDVTDQLTPGARALIRERTTNMTAWTPEPADEPEGAEGATLSLVSHLIYDARRTVDILCDDQLPAIRRRLADNPAERQALAWAAEQMAAAWAALSIAANAVDEMRARGIE